MWRIILAALALALSGCREGQRNPWEDFSGQVSCQRPRVSLRFIQPTGKDSLLMAGVESYFAKRPLVLDSLASACQFLAGESGEGWRLLGAFQDLSGGLQLVYFNRYQHHRLMAGRKLHLCFDDARKLREVYIYEVPLEQ